MLRYKFLKYSVFFSLLALVLSYGVYFNSWVNLLAYLAIIALALVFAVKKMEYAIYLALGELFIGSFGYLFSLNFSGFKISLRVGLFAVIMLVWLAKLLLELISQWRLGDYLALRKSTLFKWYIILGLFIAWGFFSGYMRGNGVSNVFLDGNAWVFFLYFLPFYDTLDREHLPRILSILAGANIVLFLLTLGTFLSFYLNADWAMKNLYFWLRDLRLAEITFIADHYWRVFIQSQIFSAVGLLIFFTLWIKETAGRQKHWLLVLSVVSSFTVMLSLSRSFWLGAAAALGCLFILLLFKYHLGIKKTAVALGVLILILGAEGAILYPLLSLRAEDAGGVGGSSRLNQLVPLEIGIRQSPLIGSGFGKEMTYKSTDPRVLAQNSSGWYSTYAFEWGYLDIILKIGLLGLLAYLLLQSRIVQGLGIENWEMGALALGLIVILVTNVFSPYLNHPLGIGYLAVLIAFVRN